MENLLHYAISSANAKPDKGMYVHYPHCAVRFVSYETLIRNAINISKKIIKKCEKSHIIILNSDIIEQTILYWACIAAGITTTILQLPLKFSNDDPAMLKILEVAEILGNPHLSLSDNDFNRFKNIFTEHKNIISYSELSGNEIAHDDTHIITNNPAYIQFSSGTTGKPKGVELTHKNIVTNIQAIIKGMQINETDNSLNWMPLYHDMGLFGYHITPFFVGIDQHHIPTDVFLRNPLFHFDVIEKTKATVTASPNFGQNLLLKHLQRHKTKTWDLSSLRLFVNGAEPISVQVMNSFIDATQKYGFKKNAMYPVYGLAEATLGVSFPKPGDEPCIKSFHSDELFKNRKAVENNSKNSVTYVGHGRAIQDCNVQIADAQNTALQDGFLGEIQISGNNVSECYFGEPKRSHKWLATGDMGFIYENNLFVTGRSKDVIIVNGRNYHVNDIEETAKTIIAKTDAKLIAFQTPQPENKLILLIAGMGQEEAIKVFRKIRLHFIRKLDIRIDSYIHLPSILIPKTSSGKLQRYKITEMYMNGEFTEYISRSKLAFEAYLNNEDSIIILPNSTNEIILHGLFAKQLRMIPEKLSIQQDFFDLGIASIDIAELISELKNGFKIHLQSDDFFNNPTIKELAAFIDKKRSVGSGRKAFRG